MRTTLNIDDDILQTVRERALREQKTTEQVVSELLRLALAARPAASHAAEMTPLYGFLPFESSGRIVTNELINHLRAGDAY